jgi:hypothetical protein
MAQSGIDPREVAGHEPGSPAGPEEAFDAAVGLAEETTNVAGHRRSFLRQRDTP